MKLIYYPFKSFTIDAGVPTILETNNHEVYRNLLINFTDMADNLNFSDDTLELISTTKALKWFGDASICTDLNKLFLPQLYKQIKLNLTAEQNRIITDQSRTLKNVVLEATYSLDLPLNIGDQIATEKVLKFCDLHFDTSLSTNCYGIIETILKTAKELNEQRILGFMNISDYLTLQELQDLFELIRTLDLTILIIKFSENQRSVEFNNCRYYYIDQDYVDWRYE